jgi:hypothetical protein
MIIEVYYTNKNNQNYINLFVNPIIWEILRKIGIKHKKYGKYVEKIVSKYGKFDG